MPQKTKLPRYALPDGIEVLMRLNALLWKSQRRLERQIGKKAVSELITNFTDEARQDSTLWGTLHMQDDPFRWVHERMRRLH